MRIILWNSNTLCVHCPKPRLGVNVALVRGQSQPGSGLRIILWQAVALVVHASDKEKCFPGGHTPQERIRSRGLKVNLAGAWPDHSEILVCDLWVLPAAEDATGKAIQPQNELCGRVSVHVSHFEPKIGVCRVQIHQVGESEEHLRLGITLIGFDQQLLINGVLLRLRLRLSLCPCENQTEGHRHE